VGDPRLEARLYSAVTGRRPEELEEGAETIANVQRLLLIREGREVPTADRPPEFNFTEPFDGARAHFTRVPAGSGGSVDMLGNVLDGEKYSAMLAEYFELRGWDRETGVPRADTLRALGMQERPVPVSDGRPTAS
jgi:aldehyde:ferredoxin oxidoreductase